MRLRLPFRTGTPSLKTMRWVPGGDFLMGCNLYYPEERPVRRVQVDGFWMDEHAVTVAEFRRFVRDTGYVTWAERPLNSGLVFSRPAGPFDFDAGHTWWSRVPGACWSKPDGCLVAPADHDSHPVTQVTYEDAAAYAAWAGKVLPTEAEWEYAARGGLDGATFAWGDVFTPDGRYMANTWQGIFPWQNLCLDGFYGTSPAASYQANGYGLYDMIGNVWEWTSDYFRANHAANWAEAASNGPALGLKVEPQSLAGKASDVGRRVIKGGSYLCAANNSARYRPAARVAQREDLATNHLGFRCILRGHDQKQPANSRAEHPEQCPVAVGRSSGRVPQNPVARSYADMALYWTVTGLRQPR
jgi:formylglycine-generating enzyme required for sulfatase activity